MPDLGANAVTTILDGPESETLEIHNVSEITWEDGSTSREITTNSTNGIVQDRTESDFFHLSGDMTDIQAIAYLDPNETINREDEIRQTSKDITYHVSSLEKRSAYTLAELKEIGDV